MSLLQSSSSCFVPTFGRSGEFSIGLMGCSIKLILLIAQGSGFDSTSKINECLRYHVDGKAGRCVQLTTLIWEMYINSENLKLLVPSGPVQV